MNIPHALRAAAERLAGKSDSPRLDAELLLAHALGIEREELLRRLHDLPVPDGFAVLVERRVAGEPVAYIMGTRDFWTITLRVTPDVLIPRPDTETLRDHWTVVTRDRLPSVHVEHTLAVTKDGIYVITGDEETYVKADG